MTESTSQEDPNTQVQAAREAFEQEFERFARLMDTSAPALSLTAAETEQRALAELRIRHLGKKSVLSACKKLIGKVAPDQRAGFGQLVQQVEAEITERIAETEEKVSSLVQAARGERERIDVTLPGRRPRRGHIHPITRMRERIEDIFVSLGYAIEDDREIETDFYNFDALNIPENHPA